MKKSPQKETRRPAPWGSLGQARYERYVAAFDRVGQSIDAGFYLEAIAILDSLICDRLASRLGHLREIETPVRWACGRLCAELVGKPEDRASRGVEADPEFRQVVVGIQEWVHNRNIAMHGTAKVMRDAQSEKTFAELMQDAKHYAAEGRRLLRAFDDIDTKVRRKIGKSPATYPGAFFPQKRRHGRKSERSRTRST